MAGVCGICRHPDRLAIEKDILLGKSLSSICRERGVRRDSLRRHRDNGHAARLLSQSTEAQTLADPDSLTSQVRGLLYRLDAVLRRAEKDRDDKLLLSAANSIRPVYELLARLLGELQSGQSVSVNFIASPDFGRLRTCIVDALVDYPEARSKVAAALMALSAEPGPDSADSAFAERGLR